MPAINGVYLLLGVVAAVGVWFMGRWWFLERGRGALRAMRRADLVTGFVTEFFDTLGIGAFAPTTAIFKLQRRMPDDEIALQLIRKGGGYVSAPSANTSGRPSPTTAQHVAEDLDGKIDMILDGGSVNIGVESTILDMTCVPPMILRPGAVT